MTIVTFKCKYTRDEHFLLERGLKVGGVKKDVRLFTPKKSLVKRCFKCNLFGHFEKFCQQREKKCPRCNQNNSVCQKTCLK